MKVYIIGDNTEETRPELKERTKSYLAGLIDAEGHCAIVRAVLPNGSTVFSCRLGIANTYKPIMKWLVGNFGGTYRLEKHERPANHNLCYQWSPQNGSHMAQVLLQIEPYLQIKKQQAKEILSLCSLNGARNTAKRAEAFAQVQKLNSHGSGSLTTDTPSFPFKDSLKNAYFAGFFDGEGTICYSHKVSGYVLAIRVGCTCGPIVSSMQQTYGGRMSFYDKGNYRRVFYWDAANHAIHESFLLQVLPYLRIKRDQAKLALQIVRFHHHKNSVLREGFYQQMKALKQDGKMIQSELTGDRESTPVEMPVV